MARGGKRWQKSQERPKFNSHKGPKMVFLAALLLSAVASTSSFSISPVLTTMGAIYPLVRLQRTGKGPMPLRQCCMGARGDGSEYAEAEQPLRYRWQRRESTPRLCDSLRTGGCYNASCEAYHGRRYFDPALGLWRTRSMFRQSTARPQHELLSLHRANSSQAQVQGLSGLDKAPFVLKAAQAAQKGVSSQQTRPNRANGAHRVGPPDESLGDKSSVSRAAKNNGRFRDRCERCERPRKVCICSSLPAKPMSIHTRLIILQHPKERRKATYGTVPIIRFCIEGVHVITSNLNGPAAALAGTGSAGEDKSMSADPGRRHMEKKHDHEMKRSAVLCEAFARDRILQDALQRNDTMLLFPDLDAEDPFYQEAPELQAKGAVNLEELFEQRWDVDTPALPPLAQRDAAAAEAGEAGQQGAREGPTLIAIDGTWAQAKAIYKHTPSLHRVQRVQFSKDAKVRGGYTFRKEPKANFLSTLESVAYCLSVMEPPPARQGGTAGGSCTGTQSGAQTQVTGERDAAGGRGGAGGRDEGAGDVENVEKTVSEWLMCGFRHMVANQVRFTPGGGLSEG